METPTPELRTRLQNAIENDDTEDAIDCLQRGLDPDVRFEMDEGFRTMSAFSLCVRKGRIAIMEALVKSGCSVNQPVSDGTTPLHYACAVHGNWPVASYLLSRGATVNALDAEGNTPLLATAIYADLSLEMFSGLLEAGTDVNCRNNDGLNVLHMFLISETPIYEDNAALIERLLSAPYRCDVNATNERGRTPLHMAILCSSFRVTRMLIMAGCALECKDAKKLTPLDYAIMHESYYEIELLVAAGVVIPRPKWIELRKSLKDNPELVDTFLEAGADFPKLSNMCRRAFYEYFGLEARTRVENLPVCPLIKKYLAFEIL